jgi:hypothetical protein
MVGKAECMLPLPLPSKNSENPSPCRHFFATDTTDVPKYFIYPENKEGLTISKYSTLHTDETGVRFCTLKHTDSLGMTICKVQG